MAEHPEYGKQYENTLNELDDIQETTFDEFDIDKNGYITHQEFEKLRDEL